MKEEFENSIRPKKLDEFIGQSDIVENLKVFIKASLIRDEALDHVILSGSFGVGKTSLAYIIASEMERSIKTVSGPSLKSPGDLASILSSVSEGDILFIDEIHRMPLYLEEMLYSAMEDYYFDVIINSEGRSKSIKIELPPFTVVGATTRIGDISAPLLSRFGIECRLELYTLDEIIKIIKRTSIILGITIDDASLKLIAKCSRKTPRIANKITKRVSDYFLVDGKSSINVVECLNVLKKIGIDKTGLNKLDIKYIDTLINKFGGGPVGVETLANSLGENAKTIEEIIESFLMQEGYIKKTLRGRVALEKSYEVVKAL